MTNKWTHGVGHELPYVLAFLKAPRPGFVKPRLARELGEEEAIRLLREWGAAAVSVVPPSWPVEVHYAPRQARAEMEAWLGARPVYCAQSTGDQGQRLQSAMRRAFERGARHVIAIGGDCPGLSQNDLVLAQQALREVDVVLGPAMDGGYYLIGLRRCAPELFRGVPWSTLHVLPATLQRITETGLSYRLLEAKENTEDSNLLQQRRAAS